MWKQFVGVVMVAVFSCAPLLSELPGPVEAEVLSLAPFVCVYRNFLTDEECDHLIALGIDRLERSMVLERPANGEERQEVSGIRTSSGAWIGYQEDQVVCDLEARIASVTQLPETNGENFHLLHYEPTQEYREHYDWFAEDQPTLSRGGNRAVSVILYLNDVEEGGSTAFPKLGISVPARKGSALFFHNCKANGEVDFDTLHAGTPVEKGEKWIATKWVRFHEFQGQL